MNQEQQPEALRLAEMLDSGRWVNYEHREKAAAELCRLHQVELALNEWLEKTEWVQKSGKPKELGMHRADVLRARIAELEAQLARKVPTKQELADYLMQQDAVIVSRSTHEGMLAATGHPTPPSMTALAAQARKGEYLDGVNIPRLREALTFLGRGNGVGEGEVASKLSEYVNSIVRAVLACKELLRSGAGQAQQRSRDCERPECMSHGCVGHCMNTRR